MINVTKKPSDTHKKKPSRRNLARNHWEIHGEDTSMVNQNVEMHSRNFKTPKIKNKRKHRNK
jgi:hypothetical protein